MGTRYDRGIFRQNQELTLRSEAQERELAKLRPLQAQVRALFERIDKLEARVVELDSAP
jgi:hypothetical protein